MKVSDVYSKRVKEKAGKLTIGFDISVWPHCVAVWDGSHANDPMPIVVQDCKPHFHTEVTTLRRLIGRLSHDPVVHASTNFPFLVQTLDRGDPLFIAKLEEDTKEDTWKYYTAEDLLTSVLLNIKSFVEDALKQSVRNVVYTVPVCFNRFQLNKIHSACLKAGLPVLKFMPQPTAVALWYAQQQPQTSSSHEDIESASNKIALIFNMDGGYCDVAVVATSKGKCQIKALAGSAIGGEDLIENVMRHLLPDSENKFRRYIDGYEEVEAMGLFHSQTQKMMVILSYVKHFKFDKDLGRGLKICKDVKREEFEEVNKDVFEKCERLIIQCLQDAQVKVEDLSDVINVGHCHHIPKVKDLLTKICKVKKLYDGMNPFRAAVCGAAVAGAVASGSLNLPISQVTPLSLGIQVDGNNFVTVIPRNTSVPTTRAIDFTTIRDDQTNALILVYEGEGQKAEENQILGYLKIIGIPAAPKWVPKIKVRMDIDDQNMLKVAASVIMPESCEPVIPAMESKMPQLNVQNWFGWHAEALKRTDGDTKDMVTLLKKDE